MTYQDALQYFGTQVKMAEALGIKQPAVSLWEKVIPAAYQYQIEVITGGQLLADEHLRRPRTDGNARPTPEPSKVGA